jgi:hypothetical protein
MDELRPERNRSRPMRMRDEAGEATRLRGSLHLVGDVRPNLSQVGEHLLASRN